MKKNSTFVAVVIFLSLILGWAIWNYFLGATSNFADPLIREHPLKDNTLGKMYSGGFIVGILIGLSIMAFSFIVERFISLSKAKGKKDLDQFLKNAGKYLDEGNLDAALDLCNQQKGSVANILRAGISRYKAISHNDMLTTEQKVEEVKKTLDEVGMLETPLMEQNLVILSTLASISTMVGLLGTVKGMITSFAALGDSGGGAAASQLSIGISEALYNTFLGIFTAIIAIVFYNFFTNKVDKFTYVIDEASLNLLETIKTRFIAKKV